MVNQNVHVIVWLCNAVYYISLVCAIYIEECTSIIITLWVGVTS